MEVGVDGGTDPDSLEPLRARGRVAEHRRLRTRVRHGRGEGARAVKFAGTGWGRTPTRCSGRS